MRGRGGGSFQKKTRTAVGREARKVWDEREARRVCDRVGWWDDGCVGKGRMCRKGLLPLHKRRLCARHKDSSETNQDGRGVVCVRVPVQALSHQTWGRAHSTARSSVTQTFTSDWLKPHKSQRIACQNEHKAPPDVILMCATPV